MGNLNIRFTEKKWDGKKVPEGQQCQRFGGNPFTPSIMVTKIPTEANAIILEFNDRDWPPMDNGGHGRIGYYLKHPVTEISIPSIPGHSFELPEGFFLIEAHRGPQWDKSGAYMPPCSGGSGHHYYLKVIAARIIDIEKQEYKTLSKGILEMGVY
jgi:phosphatidylethanolamine-binding protein (PEBP) family uncharacterized protein